MNKKFKPSNNSFHEHFKLHNYLSPEMIEQLLDKVDGLETEISILEHLNLNLTSTADYWQEKYANFH